MKVEVEKQPDSVSTLQIELPPEQVAKEWNAIADNFARHAKIPGYRPGKAPRKVIEAKFKKEIQEEVTKKLVSKSYRDAIAEKQLRVVSSPIWTSSRFVSETTRSCFSAIASR